MRRIQEFVSDQQAYDDSTAGGFSVTRADFEAAIEEVARLAAVYRHGAGPRADTGGSP